jgi:23S rRNA (uracil1939-C5)-methyltransferase
MNRKRANAQARKRVLPKRHYEPRTPNIETRVLRAGQKATLRFSSMNLDGAAVASTAVQQVAVPFALPGEEAVVEIIRGGKEARGKIVTMIRKSSEAAAPRCRHFGRCGGCQWQHLPYDAQLRHKTLLVRQTLASALRGARVSIRDAIGASPWEYRNRIQVAFDVRQQRIVAGYYAISESAQTDGDDRTIINVQECPIQHADNVRLLTAMRDVITELGWPIYDRTSGRGLVRGMIGQVGFRSGEAMVVLSTTTEVPDRMALVHAVRRRMLNLTSLLLSVQPQHSPELLGRTEMLWGRPYIEDEIAGQLVRLYGSAAVPPNPRAMPLWLEAIARGAAPSPEAAIFDAACEEGFVPIALARRGARVIGVAPDRDAMHRAWENARLNDVDSVLFYTRAPAGVLRKLHERGRRFTTLIAIARGAPALGPLFLEAKRGGVPRVVCGAHSPSRLAVTLRSAMDAGYRPIDIQPVDLLPQTSRIHCVATLARE